MMMPFDSLIAVAPRYSAEGWDAVLNEPTWLAAIIVLVLVSIWTSVAAGLREQHAIKRGRWKWLAGMRVISILLVLALLASFQRRPVSEQVEPSRVVLLVDSSNSMAFPNQLADENSSASAQASRSTQAIQATKELQTKLAANHRVMSGRCGEVVSYYTIAEQDGNSSSSQLKLKEDFNDFCRPLANESRLGDSLQAILQDYSSTPLSSVVLLSDGRTTDGVSATKIAEEYANKRVRLHTIGFGSQREPARVELRSLSVPRQVQIRDPFEVTIRLGAMGGFDGAVEVEILLSKESELEEDRFSIVERAENADLLEVVTFNISETETIVSEKVELSPPPIGKYQLITRIKSGNKTKFLNTIFESVDRKLQVLLVASAPLRDYRFLRNQLFRDDSFELDVFLQSASGGISQDVRTILETFPIDLEELDQYDIVVAHDVDWIDLGEEATDLIRDWVSKLGGGFLVVGGAVNSFQLVEQPSETALATLLPVRFREDPLTLMTSQSASSKSQIITIAPESESVDFLQISDDQSLATQPWGTLEGFYQRAPAAELKLGSTPYLFLGDASSNLGESQTLLADQFFGAGRAGYLATPEMWRLRKIDERFYTAFYTRYLRHLARGRIQGSAAVANLYFDREEYQIGQTMSVRLVMRDDVLEASDQNELSIDWAVPNGERRTLPLRHLEGQIGTFESSLISDQEGKYRVSVDLPRVAEPLIASAQSILPPRESAVRTQDVKYLRTLAESTGGVYLESKDDLQELVQQTPSRAETRLILGPIDEEFGNRIARNLLIALTVMLAFEWLLRRWWRLA